MVCKNYVYLNGEHGTNKTLGVVHVGRTGLWVEDNRYENKTVIKGKSEIFTLYIHM